MCYQRRRKEIQPDCDWRFVQSRLQSFFFWNRSLPPWTAAPFVSLFFCPSVWQPPQNKAAASQRAIFNTNDATWLAEEARYSARSLRSAVGWAMRDLWPWDVHKRETYGHLDTSVWPCDCQFCCPNICYNHREINLPCLQSQSRRWSETPGRVNRSSVIKVRFFVCVCVCV